VVTGVSGPAGLAAAGRPIDCGNSGTTLRILSGVLSAAPGLESVLTGDASLSSRPMKRLLALERMGAKIGGVERNGTLYPPLIIQGTQLHGAEHRLEVASAQLKSALILAGLWADSPSRITEPARSRDHTERMLRSLGAGVHEEDGGAIRVEPLAEPWTRAEIEVAPDLSSAAFMLGAALVTSSGEVLAEAGTNPTRTGFLDVLRAFGAEVTEQARPEVGGEPVAAISVHAPSGLHGAEIAGELTLRAIDEVPLIAALAAFANGRTVIRDAAELRIKESDRLRATRELLEAFGAGATELEDGLVIEGAPERLRPATVEAGHDHRIAMTAAVLALGVHGKSAIGGAEIIDVSYPGFASELERLGGTVRTIA
jgi:3-phosphoshikimate 1-carboxyvinyltransferase